MLFVLGWTMDSVRLDSIMLTMLFSGYNIYKIVLSKVREN